MSTSGGPLLTCAPISPWPAEETSERSFCAPEPHPARDEPLQTWPLACGLFCGFCYLGRWQAQGHVVALLSMWPPRAATEAVGYTLEPLRDTCLLRKRMARASRREQPAPGLQDATSREGATASQPHGPAPRTSSGWGVVGPASTQSRSSGLEPSAGRARSHSRETHPAVAGSPEGTSWGNVLAPRNASCQPLAGSQHPCPGGTHTTGVPTSAGLCFPSPCQALGP